jgi:hypothetical protein
MWRSKARLTEAVAFAKRLFLGMTAPSEIPKYATA